jgi:hypothetical protein
MERGLHGSGTTIKDSCSRRVLVCCVTLSYYARAMIVNVASSGSVEYGGKLLLWRTV